MKRSVNEAKMNKFNSFVSNMDYRKYSSKVYGFMKSLNNNITNLYTKSPIQKGNY